MYQTPGIANVLLYRGYWKLPAKEKTLFLTFDDGPCETTQGLLSILEEYQAKATFFCLGKNIEQYPELTQQMIEKGHLIANHGYDHLNGWKFRNNSHDYLKNVERAKELTHPTYFRPPYGKTTLKQRKALVKQGYKIIMWSFNSKDYNKNIALNKVILKAKGATKTGNIFLFHDSLKSYDQTVPMLRELLPYWKKEGWNTEVINLKRSLHQQS